LLETIGKVGETNTYQRWGRKITNNRIPILIYTYAYKFRNIDSFFFCFCFYWCGVLPACLSESKSLRSQRVILAVLQNLTLFQVQ